MKLAFMSSVWPAATLGQLIDAAKRHGYEAIELRPQWNHGHGVELTASADERRQLAQTLRDGGLPVCCLSPGTRFNQPEAAARQQELDQLHRYIDLAAEMGIPLLRVFGDPLPAGGGGARAAAYRILADCYGRGAEHAAGAGVRLAIETHMNCRAVDIGEVLFHAGYPAALWVNWHLSHCLRHGEDVDEAYRHIKGRVAHVHFSVDEKQEALATLSRQYRLLADEGYDGCWSVEVINPPDPESVLTHHKAMWPRICHDGAPS